jgi:hypothetical protein
LRHFPVVTRRNALSINASFQLGRCARRLTLAGRGHVELLGRRVTDLARALFCQAPSDSVNTIFANRRFKFQNAL